MNRFKTKLVDEYVDRLYLSPPLQIQYMRVLYENFLSPDINYSKPGAAQNMLVMVHSLAQAEDFKR